jgi:hypothetical protein
MENSSSKTQKKHSTEGLSDRITAGFLSPHHKLCTEFVNTLLDYNFNSEKTNFVRWTFIKKKQGSIGTIYPILNSKAFFFKQEIHAPLCGN